MALRQTSMTIDRWQTSLHGQDYTYTLFPVDLRASPSHLESYKMLRLVSLRTDPGTFSSNHAREAAFSEDVWRERLDSDYKRTFVSSVLISDVDGGGDDAHGSDSGAPRESRKEPPKNNMRELAGNSWIGTVRIMGPTGVYPYLDRFREAGVGTGWQIYGLSAMWVHPAHRGRGVGARLVKACLEWARANVDIEFATKPNGSPLEKVVVLLVHDKNIAARALYSSAGFADLEGVSAEEGERWMFAKL